MLSKDQINGKVIPILLKECRDHVPNVRFCCVKLLKKLIPKLDSSVISGKVKPILAELSKDEDNDTKYYAKQAMAIC